MQAVKVAEKREEDQAEAVKGTDQLKSQGMESANGNTQPNDLGKIESMINDPALLQLEDKNIK